MEPWILASASPQRKELLAGIGVAFEVIPSTFDEAAYPETDPVARAKALGEQKALEVAARFPNRFVIGCDTLVVAPDGTLLEKPVDEADARRMVSLQSGGTSVVHSGLAVVRPDGAFMSAVSSSAVTFRALKSADIDWWMQTGLWEGRSGSFQIDGPGQLLISHLEGDFSSVVGFPVCLFGELAAKVGRPVIGS